MWGGKRQDASERRTLTISVHLTSNEKKLITEAMRRGFFENRGRFMDEAALILSRI